jgi:hypothetical protein
MPHLLLLGDSTLDNGAYTAGQLPVIDQVHRLLPFGWNVSMAAIDGSMIEDVDDQLDAIPSDTTHLLLSVGGNDALMRADLLNTPVTSSGEAISMIGEAVAAFEAAYGRLVDKCLKRRVPLAVCTIYNGNFPDPVYQLRVKTVLAIFDDAIQRVAAERQVPVIDLRRLCNMPEHFANPIEPSALGGSRIAQAIVEQMTK